eukprot:355683-Chlamydomonas_euryale.AAC.3
MGQGCWRGGPGGRQTYTLKVRSSRYMRCCCPGDAPRAFPPRMPAAVLADASCGSRLETGNCKPALPTPACAVAVTTPESHCLIKA